MTTFYYSADEADEYPCVVKLTESKILVEYEDEGYVQYTGKNNGDGHFVLESAEVKGRASLHRFAESEILEGSWTEDGYRGMWRIILK